MKKILLIAFIIFVSCQKDANTIEDETPQDPDTIEVCEGCERWWYSQNVLINIMHPGILTNAMPTEIFIATRIGMEQARQVTILAIQDRTTLLNAQQK